MQPNDRAVQIASEIIRLVSRESPADGVLRVELKKRGGISPGDSRRIAGLVFDYYRWLGWLDTARPLPEQLRAAVELRQRFANDPGRFTDEELLSKAVPGWVRDEMEPSAAWARSLQSQPRLWLRARPRQGSVLAKRLGDCATFDGAAMADTLEYRGTRDLFETKEFHRGEFEIQDISSQIVGLMSGVRPGECWWDACAGSGGKTLHLSDLMDNKGLIWATDRAEWRLNRLKRRAARACAFNYRSVMWDGGERRPMATRFDGVLLDAPCSGIGTWHRNPHARWTTTPSDVQELAAKQLDLLRHISPALKIGGRLIYAVCTLTKAETAGVTDAFARKMSAGFEAVPLANPAKPDQSPALRVTLLPHECGGNGMFIAAWRRCS